jgi:hypothetical protein
MRDGVDNRESFTPLAAWFGGDPVRETQAHRTAAGVGVSLLAYVLPD